MAAVLVWEGIGWQPVLGSSGEIATTLGIAVAVKVLRESDHPAENILNRERFALEARLAARVRSENLVRVLDFGEEHGRQFLVMELVVGETLSRLLRPEGRERERARAADGAGRVREHAALGAARPP